VTVQEKQLSDTEKTNARDLADLMPREKEGDPTLRLGKAASGVAENGETRPGKA